MRGHLAEIARIARDRAALWSIAACFVLTGSGLPAALAAPAAPAASASPGDEKNLPQVTITARRAARKQLAPFVYGITDMGPDWRHDGMPRWIGPVCPLVAGLGRDDAEFILARITEIAAAAKVPLDKEECRPNLHILVTADPQLQLKGLRQSAAYALYGPPPECYQHSSCTSLPFLMREFETSDKPVRVWYQFDTYPSGANASLLRSSTVYGMGRVVVIVDARRVSGLSRQQLADYLAMVSLAQIKADTRLGSADSILRLFDATPHTSPAGLSSWDQVFLKALYATDQSSVLQREEIARVMAAQLVPAPGHALEEAAPASSPGDAAPASPDKASQPPQ